MTIEPTEINDALVYGDISPEILNRTIEIGMSRNGRRTMPGRWKNWKTTVAELLTSLSHHKVGEKDGDCILQGAVISGERKAQAIRSLDLLVIDLDTGQSIDDMRDKLSSLGLFAMIYTTHSHLKATTEVKKDAVLKHAGKAEAGVEDVVRYLCEEKRYRPEVLEGAELVGTQHTHEGVMLVVKHQPMPKFRVLLLLKEPFVIADRGGSQRDAINEWKERYAGASKLLDAFYDRSCVDPSRLFYTPRHAKGAAGYRIEVLAGEPLDLETIERVSERAERNDPTDVFAQAAKAMGAGDGQSYQTDGLRRFFGKYGDRFEIDDWMLFVDPDGDRGGRSGGPGRTHRCPNDDNHTNAGDEDDVGFFCVNASESDSGKAVAHCQHDSCARLDRINFVDLLCQRYGIASADELVDERWVPETVEEEEAPKAGPAEGGKKEEPKKAEAPAGFEHPAAAKQAILKLPKDADNLDELASAVATKIGRSGFSAATTEKMVKELSKASGIGVRSLGADVKVGETEAKNARKADLATYGAETLEILQKWNEKFAVVMLSGKVRIMQRSENTGEIPTFMEPDAFRTFYCNEVTYIKDEDGNDKKVPIAKLWLEWTERRSYTSVVFEPNLEDNKSVFNLWTGWPHKGEEKGDWSLLRSHIYENICQREDEYFHWLMTWMAQMFQFPGSKIGSAVAIQGEKGTGKSKLFDWLRAAMGDYAIKVNNRNHITGNFNAHQAARILIVAEEAFWAGDVAAGGVLKDMITSSTMQLERKGMDAIQVSNYARLAFISNERWIVPAGLDDERRYFVLRCSSDRKEDLPYFAAIDKQMGNGGLQGMIYDLMSWRPKEDDWTILWRPPKTNWLTQQAIETLDVADKFFLQLAEDGGIRDERAPDNEEIVLLEDSATLVPVKILRWYFEQFVSRTHAGKHRIGNPKLLTDLAKKWLLADEKLVRPRMGNERPLCYSVKPLTMIRENFKTMGVKFDDVIDEEAP